ncbi:collagen alpha-1(I) chain-like [Molothrus aeneus]|uniref:collagen alpha-1(I) chain-like n=1 Tax=Molothrus aeneus TaxID=84833 RepID=UPI0034584748
MRDGRGAGALRAFSGLPGRAGSGPAHRPGTAAPICRSEPSRLSSSPRTEPRARSRGEHGGDGTEGGVRGGEDGGGRGEVRRSGSSGGAGGGVGCQPAPPSFPPRGSGEEWRRDGAGRCGKGGGGGAGRGGGVLGSSLARPAPSPPAERGGPGPADPPRLGDPQRGGRCPAGTAAGERRSGGSAAGSRRHNRSPPERRRRLSPEGPSVPRGGFASPGAPGPRGDGEGPPPAPFLRVPEPLSSRLSSPVRTIPVPAPAGPLAMTAAFPAAHRGPGDPEGLRRCRTELPKGSAAGGSPGPAPRQRVWGGPLGVGPAPRPPSRRAGYLVSPPSQQIPPAALEQLGKAAGPSPGVSSRPRRRGCPSLPSPLPKTQRCAWVWGVFRLPRLPLGQHLRQERRRRRRETRPGRRSSRAALPVPASGARREPPPQDKAGTGHGQVKPLGSFILTSCSSSSSSSPGVGEAVPALPSGPVTRQLSSPPAPASHCCPLRPAAGGGREGGTGAARTQKSRLQPQSDGSARAAPDSLGTALGRGQGHGAAIRLGVSPPAGLAAAAQLWPSVSPSRCPGEGAVPCAGKGAGGAGRSWDSAPSPPGAREQRCHLLRHPRVNCPAPGGALGAEPPEGCQAPAPGPHPARSLGERGVARRWPPLSGAPRLRLRGHRGREEGRGERLLQRQAGAGGGTLL